MKARYFREAQRSPAELDTTPRQYGSEQKLKMEFSLFTWANFLRTSISSAFHHFIAVCATILFGSLTHPAVLVICFWHHGTPFASITAFFYLYGEWTHHHHFTCLLCLSLSFLCAFMHVCRLLSALLRPIHSLFTVRALISMTISVARQGNGRAERGSQNSASECLMRKSIFINYFISFVANSTINSFDARSCAYNHNK